MQELIDFFSVLAQIVTMAIDYFVGLIEDIVDMILVLGTAAIQIPQILSFLPSPIVAILTIFLTAAILYKVLGREG